MQQQKHIKKNNKKKTEGEKENCFLSLLCVYLIYLVCNLYSERIYVSKHKTRPMPCFFLRLRSLTNIVFVIITLCLINSFSL